jgi:ActD protein
MTQNQALFGILAEFDGPQSLVAASRRVHDAGYVRFEAYSPFPVQGLAEAIGFERTWLSPIVLAGGVVGCLFGYLLQVWVSAVAYPLNVGGRPLNSWPSFVPVTFEMTILFAALAAVLGMLALNGLPRPHHPLFGIERFARVTRDGFFLCILAADPKFDEQATRGFINSLQPREVFDVPWS